MPRETEVERCEVHYSGRVQGVGFRYTVRNLAARFAVTGFVRNLADGRVQMVAEGPRHEVAGLLDAIRREMGHYLHDAHQEHRPATGGFDGFQIRL